MKKLNAVFITVLLFSFVTINSFAGENKGVGDPSSTGEKSVKQGDFIIDAFYGYPYIWGALLKSAYKSDSVAKQAGVTLHNYNHFGGRFEYLLTDKIGVGVEYTQGLAVVDYISNSKPYRGGIRKQRVLAKMNIHFATSAKVDPYFTVGAGYKMTNVYSNEPGTTPSVNINLVPVAMRIGIGMRYFFTPHVGINAEIGLGGPLMQGGISIKI